VEIVLALVAGFVGGIAAVGTIAAVAFRKLQKNPQYQQVKAMQKMMGGTGGFDAGDDPRNFYPGPR
jgi:hypothetical protein